MASLQDTIFWLSQRVVAKPFFPHGSPHAQNTCLLPWLGEGRVRLGRHRKRGSGYFCGIPSGGISLRVQKSPAEGQNCWASQEGSGTLAPAFRHTNKPTAWRPAQSCPCCQGSSHHTRKRTEPGPCAACCLELLALATSFPHLLLPQPIAWHKL